MAQDRTLRLIATLTFCFLAGCATGMRPSVQQQQAGADNFFIQFDDGGATYYIMDLSNGDVTLKQRFSIPGTGYPAGMDPLGRFVWVAQQGVAEHDTIIEPPPTLNTYAKMPDGLFSASDQRDYQPRIEQIAVERTGKWAYADGGGERRIFSISPVDGHLEGAGRVAPSEEQASSLTLRPGKNIFYGITVHNIFTSTQTTIFSAYAPNEDTGELVPLANVTTEVPYSVKQMAFTPDGNYLIALDYGPAPEVHLLALDKDGGLSEVDAATPPSNPWGFVTHSMLPLVYYSSPDGTVKALRVENGALTEVQVGLPNSAFILHIASNGRFMLFQNAGVYLATLDPQTGAAIDIRPVTLP